MRDDGRAHRAGHAGPVHRFESVPARRLSDGSSQSGVMATATDHATPMCGWVASLGRTSETTRQDTVSAELGLDLVEKRGLDRHSARVYLVFAVHVAPWLQHLPTCRVYLRRAFEAAQETGDLTFAAYSCAHLITNRLASGDPLDDVEREAENALQFVQKMRFGLIIDLITGQLRLIRMLRGLTPDFTSFNDAEFDEASLRAAFGEQSPAGQCQRPDIGSASCRHASMPATAQSAVAAASNVAPLLWTVPSQFELRRISLLRRHLPGGASAIRPRPRSGPASGSTGGSSPADHALGEELPLNLRKPRCIDRRRDCAPRRTRAGCDASLRRGHPVGARARLHPERGLGPRTRRAVLRGARLRDDRPRLSAERKVLLPALGRRAARYGSSSNCTRTSARVRLRRLPPPPSARPSSSWTSAPWSRLRRRCRARSNSASSSKP